MILMETDLMCDISSLIMDIAICKVILFINKERLKYETSRLI